MKLLIISASHREGSQSNKVAEYMASMATVFEQINHLDLCRFNLPFWDGEAMSKTDDSSAWPFIRQYISAADAFVFITPEWGGMATPLLKNFLLMADMQDTAHKPALLTAVVNGISGAYPIAELRMNAMKNNKIVAVPDHLIIRNVEQVLNTDITPSEELFSKRENNLRDRIGYSIHMLHQYAQALTMLRVAHQAEPFPKQQEYSYGM